MVDKVFASGDKITLKLTANGWHIEMTAARGANEQSPYIAPQAVGTFDSPETALAAIRDMAKELKR